MSQMADPELAAGPPPPLPPGMDAVHIGTPFCATAFAELERLGASRVFVMANRSSRSLVEPFVAAMTEKGILAAPLFTDIGMGGGEDGLLKACDDAAAARADCVVTVGGGAVQDAGKLVRLWLSVESGAAASVEAIRGASSRVPMPRLPPQIACPNSFAMAELTHIAGLTTKAKVKSGAAHPAMMPTVVIFDPALAKGLPDWVRYGTALRGVEHAVGAVCSPLANEAIRELALRGLALVRRGLYAMIDDAECAQAQEDCYRGGWFAIRALNGEGGQSCYPALGHFIGNHYSARFDVHQGSCSGVFCGRLLAHHREASLAHQERISAALGQPGVPAPLLVTQLVAALPSVAKDHADAHVDAEPLREFAAFLHESFGEKLNLLSPKPFASADEVHAVLTRPIDAL